jgi:hypothetical protein
MQTRDWREMYRWVANLLKKRSGADVDAWNVRVREAGLTDEPSLRAWLTEQGVTGYPQTMLVMERFGYPPWLVASADDLIEGQYRDRPELRPIFEAILARVASLGPVTIQTRKGYVSLVTPKRTFAAVQPTSKRRVDLGLRLAEQPFVGRLESPAAMGSSMVTHRISLTSVDQVDDEVEAWLRRSYDENT